MLRQLAIRNVVLIDRLEIEFESGLGVLTGETGAGKSILLDSLGLALGDRADTALLRTGADEARITASFDLPPAHPVRLQRRVGASVRPWQALRQFHKRIRPSHSRRLATARRLAAQHRRCTGFRKRAAGG